MSYYYNYCVGYERDGKIYPLGPYDCFGKIRYVIEKSRSFASDLHDDFYPIKDEQVSDELRKEFEYEGWDGNKTMGIIKYLPIEEMPTESFIKTGYFLVDDVRQYEENHDAWDLFYDKLSPTVYMSMLQNEITFGKQQPQKDDDGDYIETHSASDYMYYAYPDYSSREYESAVIRIMADSLHSYSHFKNGEKLVILETEG